MFDIELSQKGFSKVSFELLEKPGDGKEKIEITKVARHPLVGFILRWFNLASKVKYTDTSHKVHTVYVNRNSFFSLLGKSVKTKKTMENLKKELKDRKIDVGSLNGSNIETIIQLMRDDSGKKKTTLSNGNVFDGHHGIDGKRIAQGTLTTTAGEEWSGEWGQDRLIGKATCRYPNGDVYVGESVDEKREGSGTLTTKAGNKWSGVWVNNQLRDPGKCEYPNGDVYVGESIDGQRHGKGTLTTKSGETWTGEWKNDQASGNQRCEYRNGDVYEGGVVDGKRQGSGTLTTMVNGQWSGQWEKGQLNKQGICKYENGDEYVGESVDGKRQGEGVLTIKDGVIQKGIWADDRLKGFGVRKYPDGTVSHTFTALDFSFFEGKTVDGKPDGKGTLTLRDKKWEGVWTQGKLNGQGVFTEISGNYTEIDGIPTQAHRVVFDNGKAFALIDGAPQQIEQDMTLIKRRYEGEFKNSLFHGQGTLATDNGSIYTGQFVDGKKEGPGKLVTYEGTVQEGIWKENVFQDPNSRHVEPNGDVYVGMMVDGKFEGHGILTTPDGEKSEGIWKNDKIEGEMTFTKTVDEKVVVKYVGNAREGKFHGQGKIEYYDDGYVYEGEFVQGKFEGKGVSTTLNGEKWEGVWKNSMLNGKALFTKTVDGKIIESYDGDWVDDEFHGQGTFTSENGDVYVGAFVNGRFEGQGTMTKADGTVQAGTWKEDEFVGPAIL